MSACDRELMAGKVFEEECVTGEGREASLNLPAPSTVCSSYLLVDSSVDLPTE